MAPCPISLCGERIRMPPSGSIARKALMSFGADSAPQACAPMVAASARPGNATLMATPPAAEAEVTTNWRRVTDVLTISFMMRSRSRLDQRGGAMDRAAQADIGATAADTAEIGVNVGIGRLGMFLEERRRRHDLSRLAVAALRHILGQPGLLHRMLAVGRQAFDCGDGLADDVADLDTAGAHGLAVHMHGAGAAQRDAATKFCSGQSDFVADDPKQRRLRLDIEPMRLSVDCDGDHGVSQGVFCAAVGRCPSSPFRRMIDEQTLTPGRVFPFTDGCIYLPFTQFCDAFPALPPATADMANPLETHWI